MKAGIIGCGRIARRHIEAIQKTKGIELTAVCDSDNVRANELADEFGVQAVESIEDLREIDVLAVTTPSGLHPEHVVQATRVDGVSTILCEKPVSLTVRETVKMYKAAQERGISLLPVYQNRYNPLIDYLHNILDQGRLGKIYQFAINVFWNRNDEYFQIGWHGTLDIDGGVLFTQASHYVDMLLYFFGPIREAKGLSGDLRNLEVHDSVSAVCKFESGTVGSLNATVSTYRKNYATELVIIAEKGTIRASGQNLSQFDFFDVEGIEPPDIDFTADNAHKRGHEELYRYLMEKRYDMFPTYQEVLDGIALMEKLSF
ncbi:MAG: Gfo/Idh/MocA family oxidoreductase [Spirochaetales bacterium]|nr:Gfo/Idh/MocA family oxidoreductase [Spirochaetales bacterium]MCF7937757.1 Gfo/Idh/MocA family oxidoreductase [Spirochaetales bacterium]